MTAVLPPSRTMADPRRPYPTRLQAGLSMGSAPPQLTKNFARADGHWAITVDIMRVELLNLFSPDVRVFTSQNGQKCVGGRAPPQTPLRELTALHQTTSLGSKGESKWRERRERDRADVKEGKGGGKWDEGRGGTSVPLASAPSSASGQGG